MKNQFLFSVIIPIYKVENYLSETIASVITQDIGFEENIQMILVNDGSPDNSEAICLHYRDAYPDNIIYIKQENAGVGAARNAGIPYIQGKYVIFWTATINGRPTRSARWLRFTPKRRTAWMLLSAVCSFLMRAATITLWTINSRRKSLSAL